MASGGAQQSSKAVSENLTLKLYEKKVREDVKLIHDHLHEILKLVKIDDEKTSKVYYPHKTEFNVIL